MNIRQDKVIKIDPPEEKHKKITKNSLSAGINDLPLEKTDPPSKFRFTKAVKDADSFSKSNDKYLEHIEKDDPFSGVYLDNILPFINRNDEADAPSRKYLVVLIYSEPTSPMPLNTQAAFPKSADMKNESFDLIDSSKRKPNVETSQEIEQLLRECEDSPVSKN